MNATPWFMAVYSQFCSASLEMLRRIGLNEARGGRATKRGQRGCEQAPHSPCSSNFAAAVKHMGEVQDGSAQS